MNKLSIDNDELVESLAEYAHMSWCGWVRWMFKNWDQTHANGETFQARWQRQMNTPYGELSELEKKSDRSEALCIISIVQEELLGMLDDTQ